MREKKINQQEVLQKIRVDYSINRAEFARQIGVSPTMVSNLEQGKFNITPKVARAICSVFNVNEEYILSGTGECYVDGKINQSLKNSFLFGKESQSGVSIEQHKQLVTELNEKSEEIKRLWSLINRLLPANQDSLGKLSVLKLSPKPLFLGANLGTTNALPLAG